LVGKRETLAAKAGSRSISAILFTAPHSSPRPEIPASDRP
jgi:hypothetical protein